MLYWRFDINFGQNREEIYRKDNNSYKYEEEKPYRDYDEYDDWDQYDEGW